MITSRCCQFEAKLHPWKQSKKQNMLLLLSFAKHGLQPPVLVSNNNLSCCCQKNKKTPLLTTMLPTRDSNLIKSPNHFLPATQLQLYYVCCFPLWVLQLFAAVIQCKQGRATNTTDQDSLLKRNEIQNTIFMKNATAPNCVKRVI